MKKRSIAMLLAVIMCASLIAIPVQADSAKGGATVSTALNLRSGAGTSNSILLTMPRGAQVVVLSEDNGWCKINYKGTEGYASSQYLSIQTSMNGDFGSGTVTGSDVRMRKSASTSSSVLGVFEKGAAVSVTGVSGNWYAVSYNGKSGYVSADYVKLGKAASTPAVSTPTDNNNTNSTAGSGMTGAIIGTYVNVRSGPGTNYSAVGNYSNGVVMNVYGAENGWYKVSYKSTTGFILAKYFRPTADTVYSSVKDGTVNANSVRLRLGPSTDFSTVGMYSKNTAVKVSGESGDWYEVSINGTYGFMSKDYISIGSGSSQNTGSSTAPSEELNTTGIVTGNGVRMRGGPGTSYATVGYYDKGTKVVVTGKTGSWYAVSYNGLSGYMSADYIRLSSTGSEAEKIIATAKEYLGTPYVYGGASPRGFDCSGFIYYLFGQYGYSLRRGATSQYNNDGVYVEKSQLIPGDLVFFSGGGDPISHVGMYIGDGQFIHSSSGKGYVVITALDSYYYLEHYAGAKRVLGQ